MADFPLISLSHLANVDDIDFFGSRGSISLDVKGRDFTGTSAVLINGYRSPTFVILSDSRLLADIPTSEIAKPIKTLNVLKDSLAGAESQSAVVSFEAVSTLPSVSSDSLLVQRVLKRLFTTQGSDIFSPNYGGNLLSLIGGVSQNSESLAAYARIYIRETVSAMIQEQSASSAPQEEKVQSVQVLSASYSRTHTSLDLRLAIVSMAGRRVVAGLSV